MYELASEPNKKIHYEPIERRRKNRRGTESDRRAEEREHSKDNDRRQKSDRRKH